jgi:hypothetical protein
MLERAAEERGPVSYSTLPPGVTADELRSSAARSLPAQVLDALEDLYTPAQRAQWLERYALTCARKRTAMRFFALREAGYPNSGA